MTRNPDLERLMQYAHGGLATLSALRRPAQRMSELEREEVMSDLSESDDASELTKLMGTSKYWMDALKFIPAMFSARMKKINPETGEIRWLGLAPMPDLELVEKGLMTMEEWEAERDAALKYNAENEQFHSGWVDDTKAMAALPAMIGNAAGEFTPFPWGSMSDPDKAFEYPSFAMEASERIGSLERAAQRDYGLEDPTGFPQHMTGALGAMATQVPVPGKELRGLLNKLPDVPTAAKFITKPLSAASEFANPFIDMSAKNYGIGTAFGGTLGTLLEPSGEDARDFEHQQAEMERVVTLVTDEWDDTSDEDKVEVIYSPLGEVAWSMMDGEQRTELMELLEERGVFDEPEGFAKGGYIKDLVKLRNGVIQADEFFARSAGKKLNPDLEVPKGYTSFFTKGSEVWGVTPDGLERRISTMTPELGDLETGVEAAQKMASAYNTRGFSKDPIEQKRVAPEDYEKELIDESDEFEANLAATRVKLSDLGRSDEEARKAIGAAKLKDEFNPDDIRVVSREYLPPTKKFTSWLDKFRGNVDDIMRGLEKGVTEGNFRYEPGDIVVGQKGAHSVLFKNIDQKSGLPKYRVRSLNDGSEFDLPEYGIRGKFEGGPDGDLIRSDVLDELAADAAEDFDEFVGWLPDKLELDEPHGYGKFKGRATMEDGTEVKFTYDVNEVDPRNRFDMNEDLEDVTERFMNAAESKYNDVDDVVEVATQKYESKMPVTVDERNDVYMKLFDYTESEFDNLEVYPDPDRPGLYAALDNGYDFDPDYLEGFLIDMNSDNIMESIEEVVFKTWPPKQK